MANLILTAQQEEKYPHFCQLVKDLFEHYLTKDSASKSKEVEWIGAQQEYTNAKNSYEVLQLIYNSLWNIIANTNLDSKVSGAQTNCV